MLKSGFIILVLLLSTASILAQDSDVPSHWDNGIHHSSWDLALEANDRKKLLDLWDAIGDDLKKPDHRLAGTYTKIDDNSGYFLRWSLRKGFIVVPYFDQNLITDFGYGRVTIADDSDVIFLSQRQLNGGRGLSKMPQRWASILGYFMPTERLKDFAQFRAGLGQYNEFNGRCCEFRPTFLAQRIDGEPDSLAKVVPSKYSHLMRQPITGEIISVGRRKTVKDWGYEGTLYSEWIEKAVLIPVRIDAGRKAGVKRNMLFRLLGEPNFVQYLQVMRVSERASFGYVVRNVTSNRNETFRDSADAERPIPPIRVGVKVTTSPMVD